MRSAWRWANRGLVPGKTGRARWGVGETCWAVEWGSAKRKRGGCWAAGVWAGAGEKEKGVAGWAKKEERVGRAGLLWVLDSFSNFFCISKSNPNSNSRQMNSNLNLNSHKHSTNKKMLQHDATTKIKPMINFNYL